MIGGAPPLLTKLTLAGGVALAEAAGDEEAAGALATGQTSGQPTGQPSGQPSNQPTSQPTGQPTSQPTGQPSGQPTGQPTGQPSCHLRQIFRLYELDVSCNYENMLRTYCLTRKVIWLLFGLLCRKLFNGECRDSRGNEIWQYKSYWKA